MKLTTKLGLMAAAISAALSTQAADYVAGDLIVGFTSGIGNDTIFNIGQRSEITPGQVWNVGSGLGTTFGVVGGLGNTTGNGLAWTTRSNPDWAGESVNLAYRAGNPVKGMTFDTVNFRYIGAGESLQQAAVDQRSWNQNCNQLLANALPSSVEAQFGWIPTVDLSGGQAEAILYDLVCSGEAVTYDGSFLYNSTAGTLTYVPEPGSISLVALFGAMGLALRRKLAKS